MVSFCRAGLAGSISWLGLPTVYTVLATWQRFEFHFRRLFVHDT